MTRRKATADGLTHSDSDADLSLCVPITACAVQLERPRRERVELCFVVNTRAVSHTSKATKVFVRRNGWSRRSRLLHKRSQLVPRSGADSLHTPRKTTAARYRIRDVCLFVHTSWIISKHDVRLWFLFRYPGHTRWGVCESPILCRNKSSEMIMPMPAAVRPPVNGFEQGRTFQRPNL